MAIYGINFINEASVQKTDKVRLTIWGREFNLTVKYDNYSGEEITDVQKDAVVKFSKVSTDSSLEKVKSYCTSRNKDEIDSIDNIFKYVMPKYLYIPKSKKRVVAIMCNYKLDNDNGIAIVYENEKFSKIGPQDIIL